MEPAWVDTNIVVPYLSGHDPDLLARAQDVIDTDEPRILSVVVLLETAYVLRRVYGYQPRAIAEAIHDLVARANIRVAELPKDATLVALGLWRDGEIGSARDALLAAAMLEGGARRLVTWDRRFPALGWEVIAP